MEPITLLALGAGGYYLYERKKNPAWSPLAWLFSSPFEKHAALEVVKVTSVPTPGPAAALDPNMTTDQVKQVNDSLLTETDKARLAAQAQAFRDLGHEGSANALAAKAAAIAKAKALGASDVDIEKKQIEASSPSPGAANFVGWGPGFVAASGGPYATGAMAASHTCLCPGSGDPLNPALPVATIGGQPMYPCDCSTPGAVLSGSGVPAMATGWGEWWGERRHHEHPWGEHWAGWNAQDFAAHIGHEAAARAEQSRGRGRGHGGGFGRGHGGRGGGHARHPHFEGGHERHPHFEHPHHPMAPPPPPPEAPIQGYVTSGDELPPGIYGHPAGGLYFAGSGDDEGELPGIFGHPAGGFYFAGAIPYSGGGLVAEYPSGGGAIPFQPQQQQAWGQGGGWGQGAGSEYYAPDQMGAQYYADPYADPYAAYARHPHHYEWRRHGWWR